MKTFLKTAGVMLACFVIFTGSAYLYFKFDKNVLHTEKAEEHIPYSSVPEGCGISVLLPDNSSVFLQLDFENSSISVILTDSAATKAAKYGFGVDYTVNGNNTVFEGIIDRIGGIELTHENQTLRYTGIQVLDLVLTGDKETVIEAFFNRCSEIGLTRQDFTFIIENSTTDLTVPTCFMWPDYIKEMCANVQFLE